MEDYANKSELYYKLISHFCDPCTYVAKSDLCYTISNNICGNCVDENKHCQNCKILTILQIIRDAQTKQLEHGMAKWLICSDGYYPYCSKCNNEPKNGVMSDFCPNCGAFMKGDKYER